MAANTYIANDTNKELKRYSYGSHTVIEKNYKVGQTNLQTSANNQPIPFPNSYFQYNAFGYDSKNSTPNQLTQAKASHQNPSKDHILVRIKTSGENDDNILIDTMRNKLSIFPNYSFTFDGKNSNSKFHYWNLLIEINRLVVKPQFIALTKAFVDNKLSKMMQIGRAHV